MYDKIARFESLSDKYNTACMENILNNIIIIGIGGFAGAVLRYLLGGTVQNLTRGSSFPWGTLIVNAVGCFLFGIISGFLGTRTQTEHSLNSLIFIGFLGAFTTFSTFSNDTLTLMNNGSSLLGWLNMAVSLIAGIGALLLGRAIGFNIR
jgi:fluoride exporter